MDMTTFFTWHVPVSNRPKKTKTVEITGLRQTHVHSKFSSGLLDFCDKLAADTALYFSTISSHSTLR